MEAPNSPSTFTHRAVLSKDGHPITFALHGFIEFKSLSEMFSYLDAQNQRWKSNAGISGEINEEQRQAVMLDLLRRGVESRVVSMVDEGPLETLVTHTRKELQTALAAVKEPVPPGYADAFIAVQEKWKHSLKSDVRLDRALLAGGKVSPRHYGWRGDGSGLSAREARLGTMVGATE
jgi:hypothetical protein